MNKIIISASSWSLMYDQFMMHGQKNIKLQYLTFDFHKILLCLSRPCIVK